MDNNERHARMRLIITRRARALIAANNMRPLSHARMRKLAEACVHTLGDDGVTDVDLWTLVRLTQRGLLDRFTLQHGDNDHE